MMYDDNGVCKRCHENCLDGCYGPNSTLDFNGGGCFACKYVKEESTCLKECPVSKYNDTNGECQPCHDYCMMRYNASCSGPSPTDCDVCKPGTYDAVPKKRVIGECKPCHENCLLKCYGPESTNDRTNGCQSCKNLTDGNICVKKCPKTKYDENGQCMLCHENCLRSCNGPENTLGLYGCDECKITKDGSFCVLECPDGKYDDNGNCEGKY